jgi:hypothetical protein
MNEQSSILNFEKQVGGLDLTITQTNDTTPSIKALCITTLSITIIKTTHHYDSRFYVASFYC